MVTVFEVCFYLGAILTILFFILGHISDFMNVDGVDMDVDMHLDGIDMHADGIHLDGADVGADGVDLHGLDHSADMHADLGPSFSFLLGWLRPNLIILFSTLFGGFGLIFVNSGLTPIIAAVFSATIGISGAYIINRFLIKLLKKESTTAASQHDLIGHLGRAALHMEGEKVGYIIYAVNGNTYQSPAKSYEKTPIQKGDDIIIVDIKENLFYVKKF